MTLTICICTARRPETLRRCLQSIADGTVRPDAVVVSDDAEPGAEAHAVCTAFPGVNYRPGPRRGLCANRNAVLADIRSTHFALIDDDGIVAVDFVENALKLAQLFPDTVLTGIVRERGQEIRPSNSRFLGHFGKPPGRRLETINLNCNVIPIAVLAHAKFDEAIGWGYEDMDFCESLLAAGFQIQFVPGLWNSHEPPTLGSRKHRFLEIERARFYTSVKRHMIWRPNFAKLSAYILVASGHRLLSAAKAGNWADFRATMPDMAMAIRSAARQKGGGVATVSS
jgi:glycosyltransferase involved in cell wall biosynthesis